jgi:hypothetical protein
LHERVEDLCSRQDACKNKSIPCNRRSKTNFLAHYCLPQLQHCRQSRQAACKACPICLVGVRVSL